MSTILAALFFVGAYILWAVLARAAAVSVKNLNVLLWWTLKYKAEAGAFSRDTLDVAYIPTTVRAGLHPTGLILALTFAVFVGMWLFGGPHLRHIGAAAVKGVLAVGGLVGFGLLVFAWMRSYSPSARSAVTWQGVSKEAIAKLTTRIASEPDPKTTTLLRYWRGMRLATLGPPNDDHADANVVARLPAKGASLLTWQVFANQLKEAMEDLEHVAAQHEQLPRLSRAAGRALKSAAALHSTVAARIDTMASDQERRRTSRTFPCPHCKTIITISRSLEGKKLKCKKCAATIEASEYLKPA